MPPLRFGMFGTGFWARYQLAAWREAGGVQCLALCSRSLSKAGELARDFGVARIYDDPREMMENEQLDFVDIVTTPDSHRELVELAAAYRVPVICQKPMAESLQESSDLVDLCRRLQVPFFVHENWRWQTPIRALHEILRSGEIGCPFRARIRMVSSFRVFDNQPFLKEVEKFLLMDVGSHIFDVARFLFGEARSIYCQTQRIDKDIRGEDLATALLAMESGASVVCELGYPGSPMSPDAFPQTFIVVEGSLGSAEIALDYRLQITTASGVRQLDCRPPKYSWADPQYELVHASIVPCLLDLAAGLRGERAPKTTAEDNLKTMRLVFGAYESAESHQVVSV